MMPSNWPSRAVFCHCSLRRGVYWAKRKTGQATPPLRRPSSFLWDETPRQKDSCSLPAEQTRTGEGTGRNVFLAAKPALWLLVRPTSMERSSTDVTLLLKRCSNGDQNALAELIPQIYDELRR